MKLNHMYITKMLNSCGIQHMRANNEYYDYVIKNSYYCKFENIFIDQMINFESIDSPKRLMNYIHRIRSKANLVYIITDNIYITQGALQSYVDEINIQRGNYFHYDLEYSRHFAHVMDILYSVYCDGLSIEGDDGETIEEAGEMYDKEYKILIPVIIANKKFN